MDQSGASVTAAGEGDCDQAAEAQHQRGCRGAGRSFAEESPAKSHPMASSAAPAMSARSVANRSPSIRSAGGANGGGRTRLRQLSTDAAAYRDGSAANVAAQCAEQKW